MPRVALVTYLYAVLGMAMLIPILASLEMAGLLSQEKLTGLAVVGKTSSISDGRELMEYMFELREGKGSERADFLNQMDTMKGSTYCEVLASWIRQKSSYWSDFSLRENAQFNGCSGSTKSGMRVLIMGSSYTKNPPPDPHEDFGLLACDPAERSSSTCAFEGG